LSGAYWYGVENVTPKKASRFFDELADWGERTSHATVDRGPDGPGDENPMHGLRERFVRDWPGPAAREAEADDLFASGWRLGALEAAGNGSVQPSLVDALDPGERAEFDALAAGHRELASHLREREASEGASTIPPTPPAVSVAGLHLYAECPKRFYWTSVRPLPTFRGSSARIGTEVHGWIERRASGQAPLPDLEQTPDLTSDELVGDPGKIERLQEAFLASRFAALVPRYAERAFLLSIDGFRVSGRIDAIYGEGDGPWEVVDWKTGRRPEDDPLASLQLDVYGLACVDVWGKRPADLTLTYLYLASEEEVSRPMGDADDVRTRVSETLHAIASGGFDPVPGSQCSWCDFRPFCAEGTAWVAKNKNG